MPGECSEWTLHSIDAANMRSHFAQLSATLGVLYLALPLLSAGGKRQLPHDVSDAFKMFKNFPYSIAIFDEDYDGDLDCLTTRREQYDPEEPSARYVWYLKGLNGHERKHIGFNVKAGASPDKPVYTLDDPDSPEMIANFIYTDYDNCTVLEIPYEGRLECILWVVEGIEKNIPQHCADYFDDICDVNIKRTAYDEETCSGLSDDL
ncbi:uncharacterized protein LOC144173604 [Haemaphysalis longicornis]